MPVQKGFDVQEVLASHKLSWKVIALLLKVIITGILIRLEESAVKPFVLFCIIVYEYG